ncbi:MAG: hypothetical protein R2724_27460 [Bryobacterales bacterium]
MAPGARRAGFLAYLARGPRPASGRRELLLARQALCCRSPARRMRSPGAIGGLGRPAAGLPGLGWYGWVHAHVGSDPVRFVEQWPLQALFVRTLDWSAVPLEASRQAVAGGLDQSCGHWSVGGAWAQCGSGLDRTRRNALGGWVVLRISCAVELSGCVGGGVCVFARILSPLVLWLALMGIERRRYVGLLPLALMAPRHSSACCTRSATAKAGIERS